MKARAGLCCWLLACGCGAGESPDAGVPAETAQAAFPLRAVVAPALAALEVTLPAASAPAEREHVRGLVSTWTPAPDSALGALAREELVGLGDAAVPELVALAADQEAEDGERGAALTLLAAIDSPAALDALLGTLETGSTGWLRASAAWALQETQADWILPRLLLRLKYELDHETVLWIAERLARSGNYAGLEGALVVWRSGPSEELRASAEAILVGIAQRAGASDAAALERDWQAGRVAQAQRSPRWELETWRWIARLDEYQLRGVDDARFVLARSCAAAAPLLAQALHDESVYVRVHAAQCLERMGPRAAAAGATLLAALSDPVLGPNAAAALGGLRHEPALAVLAGLCARGSEPELRLAALRALGAYGPAAVAVSEPALLPLCAPEEPLEIRQAAAESLARCASPQAPIALLAGFVTDDRVAWETSERALREWLAHEAGTRPAAARALERWDALAPPAERAVPVDERAALRAARRALVEELLAGS